MGKKQRNHTKSGVKHWVGRKTPRKLALRATSAEKYREILDDLKGMPAEALSRTAPTPCSPNPSGIQAFGENGTPYQSLCQSSTAQIFRQLSPDPSLMTFAASAACSPHTEAQLVNKPSHFAFTVDMATIRRRRGRKRPVSQKTAMGNRSAREILRSLGAEFNKELEVHLAHRQGYAIGGAQDKVNLDPATGGSNYNTLFCVEDPLLYFG